MFDSYDREKQIQLRPMERGKATRPFFFAFQIPQFFPHFFCGKLSTKKMWKKKYPFGEFREKNEDFFLTNTFQEERLNVSNENYANELIKRLKDHWNQIDDKNKETIWKYFQVLVVLSEKEG